MRILILDESKTERQYLCRLLSEAAVDVDITSDREEVAEYLNGFLYDWVLIDRFSYGGFAEDYFKEIKRLAQGSMFIVMDSEIDAKTKEILFETGVDYMIGKPVDQTELFSIILGETGKEKMITEAFLSQIPGLSVSDGIRYCGSKEALTEAIEIFYEGITEKYHEIEKYEKDGDLKNYTVKVHALKSSARLIGATTLANEAEALENAGKENNTAYIQENHGSLMEHLLEYKDIFSKFL